MKKLEKRDSSLYGIVYPNDMYYIKEKLEKLKKVSHEIYSQYTPDRVIRVEFDFSKIDKQDVYRFLVAITKLPNGIRCSERKMIKAMAMFTNLADSPELSKRINAISRSYKRYKSILNI